MKLNAYSLNAYVDELRLFLSTDSTRSVSINQTAYLYGTVERAAKEH